MISFATTPTISPNRIHPIIDMAAPLHYERC
jgi:hypothetical protein